MNRKPGAGKRRVQGGIASSDVVVSAHIGGNSDLFPKILQLHVPKNARIADITWGLGVFWRKVPAGEGFFRREKGQPGGGSTHAAFRNAYSNGQPTAEKWSQVARGGN